ncbi:hypothetical protein OEZ86_013047 [Tetradesmus obliquus]|nr:hypothetical protein OEZ86_013047 [Tetradesmus obliquus]
MSEVLGFSSWASVAVAHCAGAHGLVLTHSQGWKLVYSGDTRPCAALAAAGAGATLLIHEATFEAGLRHHACAKGHSTLQEALQVAKDMGAYRTVLTHFSQRYPRLPGGFPATAAPWSQRPLLAVDGAVVKFSLLPRLPGLMPAVAAALEELEDEQQHQQQQQQHQQ